MTKGIKVETVTDQMEMIKGLVADLVPGYSFNAYQEDCRHTDVGTAAQDVLSPGWLYYALGISGECGELTEKIKKLFRDKGGVIDEDFRDDVVKEMGDILWYMARMADAFDIPFGYVAETNSKKLISRMVRGKIHGDGDDR